jgi:dipeptide/tripeptide permease
MIIGFFLLSQTRTFLPFTLSTMLLGLGMGIFKPALQGIVSQKIEVKTTANSALG